MRILLKSILAELLSLGVWLGILEKVKRQPKTKSPPVQKAGDYRPVCPTCKTVMEFTWAETDIHGYKEEVGCWICRCRKATIASMAVSGVVT
jgi:hypothetical protein